MVLRDLVNHPAVYSFCKRAITPLSKFAASAPFMPRAASRTIARWSLLNIFNEAAVRAAITSAWSNGQTEGQITRLKLVRRQMYGRGKINLLQARLIGAE